MNNRKLGRTDILVSEIGLGTWAIGGPYWTQGEPTGWSGPLDEDEIKEAIQYAIDNGINHFDTADVYGYGKSERLLGQAIGKRRNQVTIASKVGWAATTAVHVYDPNNIRFHCEQSLRNLGTDHIDLYYFHQCDFGEDDIYLDDAVETFLTLKKEGKIRYVGLSGYSEEELIDKVMKIDPDVVQSWADIEHDEFIRDNSPLQTLMKDRGLGFVAMMPFGQGRLLGKYDPENPPTFGEGDNREGSSAFTHESLAELQPRLATLRKRFGDSTKDLARVALQFLLSNPIVSCVIPGFRNLSQVKSTLYAADKPLTSEDIHFILDVFPRELMAAHPWSE
jgi:aryl-alcohol dehydrogenase-like predicted oxidoreductase